MKQNTESDWARPLIILVNQISLVNITFYGAACTIVKGTKEEGRGLHKMTAKSSASDCVQLGSFFCRAFIMAVLPLNPVWSHWHPHLATLL